MNAVATLLKRISETDDLAVIPSSHKWTEMGVLPKDWSVQSLRSCLLSIPSYGINEAAVPFDDNLPTYLRITDISEDGQFRPSPRVSVKHPNGQAFFLNEGDLVLARTGASVGKSYLYNPKDGPLVFAGFLIRISPNPEILQPTFLAYYLQSKYYWNWVATMSIRSGQPGINGKEYGELQLPLPSLIEQRAIAEVLSDVDGLLNALEALIAKKRAIKQAVMQQLLTGKTRLPGFSGKWETKRLGEIALFFKGSSLFTKADMSLDGKRRCIHYGELFTIYGEYISEVLHGTDREETFFLSVSNDVLMPASDVTPNGLATASCISESDIILGGDILVIRAPTEILNGVFLAYAIKINRNQVMQLVTGTTVYHLYGRDMANFKFDLPSIQEQNAIVRVLSDMDAEIAALEQRRDKTLAIKQGMMQQLLTGKVRLSESRIIADDTDDAD